MKTFKVVYSEVVAEVVTLVEGKAEMGEIIMNFAGKLDEDKARKRIIDEYDGEAIVKVKSVKIAEEKRQISIDALIENSEAVSDKKDETKVNEEE